MLEDIGRTNEIEAARRWKHALGVGVFVAGAP